MGQRVLSPTLVAAALALVMGLVLGMPVASAQGTPATGGDADIGPPRPAHIHSGTCDELGDIVYPLNDLQPIEDQATPAADLGTPASDVREAVPQSETTVDVSIDELLEADHAINVHESAENIDVYIACGNITGTADEGILVVDLEELNDSGFAGIATLVDNEDGTTTVTVTLFTSEVKVPGTPVATPAT